MQMRDQPTDLSQLSTEELMQMRSGPATGPVTAPERSTLEKISRQTGLGLRTVGPVGAGALAGAAIGAPIGGVGAIPGALAGAGAMSLVQLVDNLAGTHGIDWVLDKLGLPKPETSTERVIGDVMTGISGQGGIVGAGRLLAKSSGPTVSRIGEMLISKPALQVGAVTAGAGTGAMLREGGASYPAQFGGNIVASLIAPQAAAKAGRIGYRGLIEPWLRPGDIKGRGYLEAAGDKVDEIGSLLRINKQIVPGSQPTAGEAAVPAGRTEFAALQRSAEKVLPSDYLSRSDAQNAARIAQLRTVGQTPKALKAAEAARKTVADINYGAAYQKTIRGDKTLKDISQNPYFKEALPDAIKLAEAQGINSKTDLTQFLHYVKVSLDKQLARAGDAALDSTEKAAVANIKEQLIKWMGNKNKAYETARFEFAKASEPINQMKIGQFLESKLVPALSDEAKQKSASFAGALENAPATIKRATGGPRFKELTKVLTPKQMQAVNSIQDDLARDARFNVMAQKGSKAAPSAIELASASMRQEMGGKPLTLLHRGMMVANALWTRLEGKVNRKLAAEMAAEMLNPPEVAESLSRASARAAANKVLAEDIARLQIGFISGSARVSNAPTN
jgi:hypothetical protein